MPYASAQDLLDRFDARRIGDLILDDDKSARATVGQILSSAVVSVALTDASGMVDAACQAGEKYTQADLTNMAGTGLNLLKWITCSLAYGLLVRRRGHNAPDLQTLAPQFYEAQKYLEALRLGEVIFPLEANEEAGIPQNVVLSKNSKSLMLTAASRYFGLLSADFPGV